MPPTTRGASSSFVALWVEDDVARVWDIDIASGAMDELARFNIAGMKRPNVIELARQFMAARGPRNNAIDELTASTSSIPSKPMKQTRHAQDAKKRYYQKRGYQSREDQIARQAELSEALARHPEGISAGALAEEMGRSRAGAGVPLGVLKRQGRARLDGGLWFAVGTDPPELTIAQ